jgi:hypothetical protein
MKLRPDQSARRLNVRVLQHISYFAFRRFDLDQLAKGSEPFDARKRIIARNLWMYLTKYPALPCRRRPFSPAGSPDWSYFSPADTQPGQNGSQPRSDREKNLGHDPEKHALG